MAENHGLVAATGPSGEIRSEEKRKEIARNRTLAIALIRGADPTRYGTLITELSNRYAMGVDNYPLNITAAYGLLVNYKTPVNAKGRGLTGNTAITALAPESSTMTFVQQGATAGQNGTVYNHITCFSCNQNGHYASDGPDTATGTTLMQHGYMLSQADDKGIDPD